MPSRKLAIVSQGCVACGVCEKECPIGAVAVDRGLRALVDQSRCVGCGKCAKACPASVIDLQERAGA